MHTHTPLSMQYMKESIVIIIIIYICEHITYNILQSRLQETGCMVRCKFLIKLQDHIA